MIPLHPEFLTKNGKREFAVLPYDEYLALREYLEDAEDLRDLREVRSEDGAAPSVSLSEVKKQLGLD